MMRHFMPLTRFNLVQWLFQQAAPLPGKYLVICNITPHFEESQMWGWVIVN